MKHEFHCKLCGKHKILINRKSLSPLYCSIKCCNNDPKKRSRYFEWKRADEEERKAKILQNFYRHLIIKNGCWSYRKSKENGYVRIEVSERKRKFLHVLSWEIHYGRIPKGMIIRHLCNTPDCCRPSHLAIGTYQDNSDDMRKAGRNKIGSKHPMAKLNEEQVKEIKHLFSLGISGSKIAKKFCVTRSQISYIKTGKQWKHVI